MKQVILGIFLATSWHIHAAEVFNSSSLTQLSVGYSGTGFQWQGYINPDKAPSGYSLQKKYMANFFAGVGRDYNAAFMTDSQFNGAGAWTIHPDQIHDAVGFRFLPSTDNHRAFFYPVDPANNRRLGESFIVVDTNVGFGLYSHAGNQRYRPSWTTRYIFQKEGAAGSTVQGAAVAHSFSQSEYKNRPFNGNRSAMLVEIENYKFKTAEVNGDGNCRFNFTVVLHCPSCTGGKTDRIRLLVRPASAVGDGIDRRQGFVSLADSGQYNMLAQSNTKGTIEHHKTSTVVAKIVSGQTIHAPSPNAKTLKVQITHDQFRSILANVASHSQSPGRNLHEKAANFYGSGWGSRANWYVKNLNVRMELDQHGTQRTRCGGSFQAFKIRAQN